jgi:type VII secretion protein EccE
VVVSVWWRRQFVTTMIGRRIAVWRRNHSTPKPPQTGQVTVLLRVEDPAGVGLALPLVSGYVERYGMRCEKVRVTSRDRGGVRTTWIGVTLDAAGNLAALQARSAQLPLAATAEIVGRRLADQLRETGLDAVIVDDAETPLAAAARESWRAVRDDRGAISAYEVPIDARLAERLSDVWSQPNETWTALEFSGTSAHPNAAAVCAIRTAEPVRAKPLSGLVAYCGSQLPLLTAMAPHAVGRFGVTPRPLPAGLLERIVWPPGATADFSRT